MKMVNKPDADITSVSIDGEQYDADKNGVFDIKPEHVEQAKLHGLVAPKGADKAAK